MELKAFYNKSNPPWADKAVRKNEARIKRAFGAKSLPETKDGVFEEYGCGHYGCVYPTVQMGKVLKVTSDSSEVEFVKFILKHKDEIESDDIQGIVRYYGLLNLKTKYRKRDVFAILREEAFNVGNMINDRMFYEVIQKVLAFKFFAGFVRDLYLKHGSKREFVDEVEVYFNRYSDVSYMPNGFNILGSDYKYFRMDWSIPGWLKYSQKAAFCLVGCKAVVEDLTQTPYVYEIGKALAWFLCKGKLLADVHLQNIGEVIREENYREPIWVITDPGHAVDVMPVHTYICD